MIEKVPELRIRAESANMSPAEKADVQQHFLKGFEKHRSALSPERKLQLKNSERSKTPDEIEYIRIANETTNHFLRKYGKQPFDIPERNVHLISDPEIFQQIVKNPIVRGRAVVKEWSIYIGDEAQFGKSQLLRATTIFHEMLHLKAAISFAVRMKDNHLYIKPYQEGIAVLKKSELQTDGTPNDYFEGAHEATVAVLEHEYRKTLQRVPSIELEWHTLKHLVKAENIKLYLRSNGLRGDELLSANFDSDNEERLRLEFVPYKAARLTLSYICNEISNDLPERFKSKRTVFDEFVRVHFTNDHSRLGPIIENAFGAGAYKRLARMSHETESAQECLREFRLRRRAKLKSNR